MRILLAVDDSPCSQSATEVVISQNTPANTKVQVLHVVEPYYDLPMYDAYGPAIEVSRIKRERLAQAHNMMKRTVEVIRAAGFEVTTIVEEGDPKKIIIDVAIAWNADLIVVGSHGRSGVDRFLLGSVSEAVARYAPCSIEIIRDASAIQTAKEQARLRQSEKCGHPSCTCTSKSGKYCSAQCEAMSQTPDIDCRCGHPECKGRAH
jgi:nucleotide-binding universal stress UspA family protein